jgi:hypothetical protein
VRRWQKVARDKLSLPFQPSDVEDVVNVAIEEFFAACVGESVEIFAGGAVLCSE